MPDQTAAKVATNGALKSRRGQSSCSGVDLKCKVMYLKFRKCHEMWSCDNPQRQDAVFFVLFCRSSTLFVVYPLTLPLCIKKFCISGTACPPSDQVSGRLVLVLIEQDVAQWEQLELRKLEDLSRLSRALRLIYTTCGFLMYTQCIVTSSLKKKKSI